MSEKGQVDLYSKFSFEDFLNDDFFLSSMKSPTKESMSFWVLFEEEGKNILVYKQAKSFLQAITDHYNDQNEIDKTIEDLKLIIEEVSNKKKKRRKLTSIISAIAAVALLLIIAFPFFNKDNNQSKLLSFVEKSELYNSQAEDNENITLIMSDENIVEVSDKKESIISVNNDSITIDNENISTQNSVSFNQLIVPKGKRSQLTLADGSLMYINSGTKVIYPVSFDTDKREIYVDGEVWIDVKKDKDRPFIVSTSSINIEVTGTSFNIQAYKNDSRKQVVLQTGSVKVTNTSNTASFSKTLTPSEMLELNNDNVTIANVDVSKYTSWLKGIYYYESENMESITKKLSRYYGKNVICGDNVSQLICSGKIDIDKEIEEVLSYISYVLNLKIDKNEDTYILNRNK